ncbi:MAG: hypothetical protein IJP92_06600 [Lachnospiraceae bacterium]|nr:hypothetical protein [Lachnospiraceae bacterium]
MKSKITIILAMFVFVMSVISAVLGFWLSAGTDLSTGGRFLFNLVFTLSPLLTMSLVIEFIKKSKE